MKDKKTTIVIILLLLTLISPLIGMIGCVLMWFWTKWTKWVKITITLVSLLPIIFLVMYVFLFRPFQVNGEAMSPNYKNSSYVMSNLISLRFASPARRDVIVFKAPPQPDKDFIKRVIGMPGDTIMFKNGNVYIDSQLLDERVYLQNDIKTHGGSFLQDGQEITVPSGSYFVMGDNRQNSLDSREWGFVPARSLIGKIAFCYWNCH